MAGGVAHDFNNLLTAITGYSELLLDAMPEGTLARADAEGIRRAAGRAASLTRQLLAFSRGQVLELELVDVNGIVLATDKLLRRLIGEDVELVTVAGAETRAVNSDPGQLEQVLINLALNARDAMPAG
ncbi:MAG: sensor histidine kinase [Gaiellaceae bacterium]